MQTKNGQEGGQADNPIDYDSHDLKSPLNENDHVQDNNQNQILSPDKS